MHATRRTQPYRRGQRQPGAALTAMKRGTSASGGNPSALQALMLAQARKPRGSRRRRGRVRRAA